MNRRVAFPFLTLSDAAVEAEPWSFSLNNDGWQTLGEVLPDWDSASKLRIRRAVRVTPEIAADDLGITTESPNLSLGLRIGTGPGRLPRLILHREYRELAAGAWQAEFEIELPSAQLSLILDVQTQVTIPAPLQNHGPLSPRQPASRLWSDTLRVQLEGEDPRFPMETARIRELLGEVVAAEAPWYLDWSPGAWHHDFHGAARLYINAEQPDFIGRIEEQDAPTLQVLLADVMGQICERLVSDPEADEIMAGAEPGSLGAQAAAWLRAIWPGKDATSIRSVLEQRPGRFRAAFLELAEVREV